MAKPKRAPLYEVLSKSKNPPLWTQKESEGSNGEAGLGEGDGSGPDSNVQAAPTPTVPVPKAATPEPMDPVEGRPGEPVFQIEGRVVRIALDSTKGAVALFALVALVTVAYMLGHSSGFQVGRVNGYQAAQDEGAPDEMEATRQTPPDSNVTEGLGDPSLIVPAEGGRDRTESVAPPPASLTSRVDAEKAPDDAGKWTVGLTYIVVQDFAWSARADALRAQEYLQQYSIETALEATPGKWYHLVTRQGFDRDDTADRDRYDRYHRRIRSIGETYFKNGGRYKLEGYPKKFTQDHW